MQQKNSWVSIIVILVVFAICLALPTATVAASQYNVLHRFAGGPDGKLPQNLIFDAAGNLYGITVWGGASGWGTVLMMAPNSDGTWMHIVLCSFTGAADGSNPTTTLIFS